LSQLEELSRHFRFSAEALKHLQSVYGSQLEPALEALRSPCRKYYFRANTIKARPRDVLEGFRKRGFNVEQHPDIEEALYFNVEGPLEVPEFSRKVMADKFAAEAVLQGANLYAAGVVNCSKLRLGDEVTMVDVMGHIVGSGVARMGEKEILTFRRGLAVEVTHPRYRIPSLRETDEFNKGLVYEQSFPAILTSRILEPKPSETILDVGASPGGKTSHIAALTENSCKIFSVDRNMRKIGVLKENLNRLGVTCASTLCTDARYLDLEHSNLSFDKACIDVSCSSLGVRPKLFEQLPENRVSAVANYQKQFFKPVSKLLKSRGRLVYSTCTLTKEENEEVIRFASENCDLQVQEQKYFYGSPGFSDIFAEATLTQRFHPHIHDTPGYFIAHLQKQ